MASAPSPMRLPRVRIASPAAPSANNGNAHTAARWERFLAPVAVCDVAIGWNGEPIDLLVALHARRSAQAVARFRFAHPDKPVVLVLTGTDLYRDLESDASARHSLECASAVVVLHEGGAAALPAAARGKTRVIPQSAGAVFAPAGTVRAGFVAVGHLREEKDPVTLMRAAARAPECAVTHIGAALDPALGTEAERTQAACPRYRWLGAVAHGATRRRIAGAAALVHPSRMEGGANAVIEAVRSGVPVLASRIEGNLGLLGAGYDGCFAVGDAAGLAALMRRVEADAGFARHLESQCAAREPLFRPAAERAAVRSLVAEMLQPAARAEPTIAA